MIFGEKIALRDAVQSDVPLIMKWENDPKNWEVSETSREYSKAEIVALLASSDNYSESQQKRWVILDKANNKPLGTVDVFQGELADKETGIGILIAEEEQRRKGFAVEAIELAISKCKSDFGIDTVHVTVQADNKASLKLFEKCGFRNNESPIESSNFDLVSPTIIKMSLCLKK